MMKRWFKILEKDWRINDMQHQKTMSIRMSVEDYVFVNQLAREEKEDTSKEVRKLVDMGRLMLGIDKYKKKEASLGKAAELAGLSIAEMVNKLAEYGVKSDLAVEDYQGGLNHLKKIW